ncbi:MAG: 4Fe-4S binding protein, partial [Moorella sp. (in: Bacteria)]|nr:4Fe-4S binding protein [Moorella sp. (in: firmicutes)]
MLIAVASGKGGTGKTTVAVSLALALAGSEKVQYLDCDVEEPNGHLFLKPRLETKEPVTVPVPKVDQSRCTFCGRCAEICAYHALAVLAGSVLTFPELCHSCGGCWYFCPEKALTPAAREIGWREEGWATERIAFTH